MPFPVSQPRPPLAAVSRYERTYWNCSVACICIHVVLHHTSEQSGFAI